jgi:hypothetical protein
MKQMIPLYFSSMGAQPLQTGFDEMTMLWWWAEQASDPNTYQRKYDLKYFYVFIIHISIIFEVAVMNQMSITFE